MHLEYAVEKTNEILFDLPPPFLKQRYGKRQTFPNPTAKNKIKMKQDFHRRFSYIPNATNVKKNSTGFVHCLRYAS
jgi:hypothetical protein